MDLKDLILNVYKKHKVKPIVASKYDLTGYVDYVIDEFNTDEKPVSSSLFKIVETRNVWEVIAAENFEITIDKDKKFQKGECMKIFVTKYTFDNGTTLAKQSIAYEYPEYSLGEDATYEVFLDNKMQTKKGIVVKVSQEIKEMDEYFTLLIK